MKDKLSALGLVLNNDLDIVTYGDLAKSILGYEEIEIVGKNIMDFLSFDSQKIFEKSVKKAKLKRSYEESELIFRNKKNATKYTKSNIGYYIVDETEYFFVELFDITIIKQMESTLVESKERYRIFFKNGNDAIFVFQITEEGIPGNFIEINNMTEKLTGFNKVEMIQRSIIDIIDPDDFDNIGDLLEKILNEKNVITEINIITKNEEKIIVELNSSLIELNETKTIISIGRDVTSQKKAEKEVKKSIEALEKTLDETVNALSSLVEQKDPYTAGHQKRTAILALAIGRELGFDENRLKGLKYGTILHDIGKISTPAEILTKPGQLNKAEMELIRFHPETGYNILKNIPFPWNVGEMVYQHHEKIDGSGYPLGLKEKDIMLEAQIIAVADTVEAMSSHRPYRASLGIELALEEIRKKKGIYYSKEIVDICMRLFKEKKFTFQEGEE